MISCWHIFLSDRFRHAKIAVTLAAIGMMAWYGGQYHPFRGALFYLASPDRYDGQPLMAGPYYIQSVHEDGFTLKIGGLRGGFPLKVVTRDTAVLNHVEPGQHVTVQGTFHRDGTMTLHAFHVNRGRDLKIAVSIIPLLVIAVLLYRTYTFVSWRITLRTKNIDA